MHPLNITLLGIGIALAFNFGLGLLLYAHHCKLEYDRAYSRAVKRAVMAGFGRTVLRLAAAGGVVYLTLRIFGVI